MAKLDCSHHAEARNARLSAAWQGNANLTARLDPPHEAAALEQQLRRDEPQPYEIDDVPTVGLIEQLRHTLVDGLAVPDDPLSEKIRIEAAQLAEQLRKRQQELDAREATLNAQIARDESNSRATRLWLDEQQTSHVERAKALAEQEHRLAQQATAMAAAQQAFAAQQRQLADEKARLAFEQQELADRRAQLVGQRQKLEQQEASLAQRNCEADQRLERLAMAESALERREHEMAQRMAAAEQSAAMAQRLASEDARAAAELERKRQAVERRAEHVDQSRAGLQQIRDELGKMHRETLEIRLATEELWVQLSGAAPPAALVRSLGQIRTKLAQQYARANAELTQQRQDLETVRSQLAAQYEKIEEHKRQFDRWAADCQQDTQQQAARLMAREKKICQEESRLREQFSRWRAERTNYQRHLLHQRWRKAAALQNPVG